MAKTNQKMQTQKYSPFYAFSLPRFHEALKYFVQQMRITNFARAHDRVLKRYGNDVTIEVEIYCQEMCVTIRPPCGRLFLAGGYEKRLP